MDPCWARRTPKSSSTATATIGNASPNSCRSGRAADDALMDAFVDGLLAFLALPKVGLPAVFLIALISATLLPLGSEPAVFGYVRLAPEMFWPAIVVATCGNTIGGMIDWWMGHAARKAWILYRRRHRLAGGDEAELAHKRPKLYPKWF